MLGYIAKRLLMGALGLLVISFIIFVGVRFAPGDPADLMIPGAPTREERARIHKELGLDKPVLTQYSTYIKNIIVHGDFGKSYYSHEPVIRLLATRIPVSLQLVVPAFILIIVIGIATGLTSVIWRNSVLDYAAVGSIYLLQSLPDFWVGILLILLFAVKIPLFPAFGRGSLDTLVLPVIALSLPLIGRATRFVRNGLLEVMNEDYIRTAYSKGLSTIKVFFGHAFRNALIPLVTDVSMQFIWTIGNAIVIETVFSWGGIGSLTINALRLRDYPTAQACILFFAVMFMVVNLLVDVLYSIIDPRIKLVES